MKKLAYILTAAMTLFMASCEDELVQNPNTTKVADNFYSNEAELEEAINAVYATLQFTGVYNTGMPAVGELPGEDAYDDHHDHHFHQTESMFPVHSFPSFHSPSYSRFPSSSYFFPCP